MAEKATNERSKKETAESNKSDPLFLLTQGISNEHIVASNTSSIDAASYLELIQSLSLPNAIIEELVAAQSQLTQACETDEIPNGMDADVQYKSVFSNQLHCGFDQK